MAKKKKKSKNKLVIWLEYASFRMLLMMIWIIPERILYPMCRGLFRIGYYIDARHRNRAIRNLLYSGIAKDRAEAVRIAKANFSHFANIICDIGTSRRHIRKENIEQLISVSGDPELLKFVMQRDDEGRTPQIIVATAHFGNWEVAGNMYVWLFNRNLLSVMRPLDNPLIGNYIYNTRQSNEHRICSKEGALKQLLMAARNGESICLVVDQHAMRSEAVEVTLFGKPVFAHASLAKLHLRTGLPIMVGAARRLDDKHHYSFDGIARIQHTPTNDHEADVKAVTQAYMDALEKMIMLDPTQWLWPHRRFIELRREDRAAKEAKKAKKEGGK